MALVSQPIGLSGFSYSCDSTRGLAKRAPKAGSMSWSEFRECMKNNMTYEDVNAICPMTVNEYKRRLKQGGYAQDHVRKHNKRLNNVCSMYDAGASVAEIAKANSISEAYCKQLLIESGRSTSSFNMIMRDKAKVKAMIDKGYTKKEIAKELGIGPGFLAEILQCMNLKTKREQLIEFAEDLTKSKLTALLQEYGNIIGVSKATGLSVNKLRECAKILNVVV